MAELSNKQFLDVDNVEDVKKIMGGVGPILLPRDTSHDMKLFGNKRYQLPIGNIVDVSQIDFDSHFYKYPRPKNTSVCRNIMSYNIVKSIKNNSWNVILIGKEGIGKSFLAHQVGYFFHSRHTFSDGVYFIEMKNLKVNQDFY